MITIFEELSRFQIIKYRKTHHSLSEQLSQAFKECKVYQDNEFTRRIPKKKKKTSF